MKRNSNKQVLSLLLIALLGAAGAFASGQGDDQRREDGVPILEVWWAGGSNQPAVDPDNPFVQRAIDEIGIGWERPNIPWNSGKNYGEQLKLRLAAGDPPDIYRLPNFGFSIPELAEGGAAADLTELLPLHAPTIYKTIPEEMWRGVRYESPDRDKLFYIPALRLAPTHGAFIRQDWLDRLGLAMPRSEKEFFAVLRAFKERDANGNGDPNDEIPTGGRGPGRWWDHLFTPYGAAMFEGFPGWDYYDGTIQYAGVQPEMKRALASLRRAYEEGLIDPEVLVNKAATWDGKLKNDQVGVYFHMPIYLEGRTSILYSQFPEAEMVWMPPYKVEGAAEKWSRGYVSFPNTNEKIIIAAGDRDRAAAALKLLEHLQQPDVTEANLWGIEGVHYTMEGGERVRRTDNLEEQKKMRSALADSSVIEDTALYRTRNRLVNMGIADEALRARIMDTDEKVLSTAAVIPIAGAVLPLSIYDGYPDIATHKLYFSTIAKIIIGELEIDAFDDYVERWYATGGREVTERAQKAARDLGL